MHSICVRTVTWAKLTDSCNIVASVHMQTCHPVHAPFLQACQPAVPNPLIFTLLQPLFFSPIKLLSHTHCSSYPSSCCPTPASFLTYRLLFHTHCSHPSTHCPTATPELLSLLPLITLNYSVSSTYSQEGFCFCFEMCARTHRHTHRVSFPLPSSVCTLSGKWTTVGGHCHISDATRE